MFPCRYIVAQGRAFFNFRRGETLPLFGKIPSYCIIFPRISPQKAPKAPAVFYGQRKNNVVYCFRELRYGLRQDGGSRQSTRTRNRRPMIVPVMILPTALLTGLLLLTFRWVNLVKKGLASDTPIRFPRREWFISGRDGILMSALTLLYAFIAFIALGDTTAPESYCVFESFDESVTIYLPEDQQVSGLMYFTGLYTGAYKVDISYNGGKYFTVGSMDQSYKALFKWQELELDTHGLPVRAIRITSSAHLELGEIAILDENEKIIPAENLLYGDKSQKLFDEQDKVPDAPSWRNSTYFDEIYLPRTAYEYLRGVYPYEISHPPLGKMIISVGIAIFGMVPFGWRCMGVLFGALMLPILYMFLKRMFGNTPIAALGTSVFATDFMHFTQTRLATIDTYAVFFILLMYLFMYEFVRYVPGDNHYDGARQKRCLFLSGLFFGIGAACKWTCIYAGMGLALIWFLYWLFRGFAAYKDGEMVDFFLDFGENVVLCLLAFVLIPGIIYYVSYIPYGLASDMKFPEMLISKDYAKIVLDNQKFMFRYHSTVTATHPYSSRWYQWILDMRPILYYMTYTKTTETAIAAFVNPVLCWGGFIALIGTAWLGRRRHDKKALFIIIGYLAQLVPWMGVDRVIFVYHYFTCLPFLILALGYVFDALRDVDPLWRRRFRRIAAASLGLFLLFFPVLYGQEIGYWFFDLVKWLPAWPI